MNEDHEGEDVPALTTRIDGEEVRLLVHIEPCEDAQRSDDEPPAMPE